MGDDIEDLLGQLDAKGYGEHVYTMCVGVSVGVCARGCVCVCVCLCVCVCVCHTHTTTHTSGQSENPVPHTASASSPWPNGVGMMSVGGDMQEVGLDVRTVGIGMFEAQGQVCRPLNKCSIARDRYCGIVWLEANTLVS
jgi:hypothetical protein